MSKHQNSDPKQIGHIKTFCVIFFQAFDGEMATTLKELPVTYLIPVVINNHFYGNPNDFKEIVEQFFPHHLAYLQFHFAKDVA